MNTFALIIMFFPGIIIVTLENLIYKNNSDEENLKEYSSIIVYTTIYFFYEILRYAINNKFNFLGKDIFNYYYFGEFNLIIFILWMLLFIAISMIFIKFYKYKPKNIINVSGSQNSINFGNHQAYKVLLKYMKEDYLIGIGDNPNRVYGYALQYNEHRFNDIILLTQDNQYSNEELDRFTPYISIYFASQKINIYIYNLKLGDIEEDEEK